MNRERLREFIAFLKDKTALGSEELLEKDFYMSALLARIASEEYAFKGGTCLAKAYLQYHRISEDIDLTFSDQRLFEKKTTKQIKRICSEKTALFGRLLESAAGELGFDFRPQKGDKRYVERGSNNKLATFKVWYTSVFTGAESFVKIQITFLEAMRFPLRERTVSPLVSRSALSHAEQTYFSGFLAAYEPLRCLAYDAREIASEKIRALLTRRGVKTRDIVDLYFLEKKQKIDLDSLKGASLEKIQFAIGSYAKYKKNMLARPALRVEDAALEDVERLLLIEVDTKDFEAFAKRLLAFVEGVRAAALSPRAA